MKKQERLPKAEYFRLRYKQAVESGKTSKAEYYKSRLVAMGEPTKESTKGSLTRSEFFGGSLVIYSM